MGVISVKLNPTNVFHYLPCVFCGGHTERDSALADLLEDGKSTGKVVCPECLADPDLGTTIRARALRLRKKAFELDSLAEHIPALPTMTEWRGAMIAAATWRGENTDCDIPF